MRLKRLHAYGLLLIAAIIWGIAVIVVKLTLVAIDPFPFLIYRFGISAVIAVLFFVFFAKKSGLKIRNTRETIMILGYGILSTTVALGLLFLGLDHTTVLNLTLITLAGPLFIEAAGMVFLKEHLTHREKLGTAVAFLGTGLLIVGPVLSEIGSSDSLVANVLVVSYLVADIAAIVFLKKLLRLNYSSATLTNASFILGFTTLLPVTLLFIPLSEVINQITSLPVIYHAGVWYMAIFSGTIAYWIRGIAQKTIEVGEAGLFGYITPIISGILALVVLGDSINFLFIAGAIIIALGVALAEYKP